MIEKARAIVGDLYGLHDIPNDAERLITINGLLGRNMFAVRDTDRLPPQVGS